MVFENNKQPPLGQPSQYLDQYCADLLCPIARQLSRDTLGIDAKQLPFHGGDIWNAYELSWLDTRGKPQVAMARFHFPCESKYLIESKSFKLYLNSFNQTRVDSIERLQQMLVDDLSKAAAAPVQVMVMTPEQWANSAVVPSDGQCLDNIDITVNHYHPQPSLLSGDGEFVDEQLYSHLFRSLCPVTGQPDWASVYINYTGPKIHQPGLLAYLISFRQHQDFHEQCVEQIFLTLLDKCKPIKLCVAAYFLRRGGLDINPYRYINTTNNIWTNDVDPAYIRLPRQ